MIIYTKGRRSGKTTEAIKLASSTRSVLVVPTRDIAKIVEYESRELKYPVEVISAKDYFNPRYPTGNNRYERVVIDELDWCLREVFGCDVIMATTTGLKGIIEE